MLHKKVGTNININRAMQTQGIDNTFDTSTVATKIPR